MIIWLKVVLTALVAILVGAVYDVADAEFRAGWVPHPDRYWSCRRGCGGSRGVPHRAATNSVRGGLRGRGGGIVFDLSRPPLLSAGWSGARLSRLTGCADARSAGSSRSGRWAHGSLLRNAVPTVASRSWYENAVHKGILARAWCCLRAAPILIAIRSHGRGQEKISLSGEFRYVSCDTT